MPKTNIEQLKEKAREEFHTSNFTKMDLDLSYRGDRKGIIEWWLSKLDQALQARNEEVVELLNSAVNDYIEKAKVRELYVESIPVIEVDRIINLISPGRK